MQFFSHKEIEARTVYITCLNIGVGVGVGDGLRQPESTANPFLPSLIMLLPELGGVMEAGTSSEKTSKCLQHFLLQTASPRLFFKAGGAAVLQLGLVKTSPGPRTARKFLGRSLGVSQTHVILIRQVRANEPL